MSVIATDGKTMAGDGRVCLDHLIVSDETEKLRHLANGAVFGAVGTTGDDDDVAAWLNAGADPDLRPDVDKDFGALILKPDGLFLIDGTKLVADRVRVPMAIGCGGELALGFMLTGMSPADAVRATFAHSCYCGGAIQELQPRAARSKARAGSSPRRRRP